MIKQQQENIKLKCQTMSKLRTFIKIKNFNEIPAFLMIPLTYAHRRIICKARLGCLQLRLETARYSRPRIPPEDRLCQICENMEGNVECIYHLLFVCGVYKNERSGWLQNLILPDFFEKFKAEDKLSIVLSGHYNIKHTARFIMKAMDLRSNVVKNKPNNEIYHTDPPEECSVCNMNNA